MQLCKPRKLASLGRMSAGIIHEITIAELRHHRPLYLPQKGPKPCPGATEDYTEVLNDIEEGVKRVKTIVSDLQMFTHPETESRDQVAVAEVVASALRF